MTLQDITQLFDYIYWARDRVLPIVDTLDPEAFTRDMHTSHGSIQKTLVHMFGSEMLWMTRWKGVSPTSRERPEDYPTVADVRARWGVVEQGVRDHLAGMRAGDENQIVRYSTLEGAPVAYPWWQTALQVTNHSTYHRGQIISMLRQAGAAGVGTDIIIYYKQRNAAG